MEEFTISIPPERPFAAVADLVVGGIASRHAVTLDVLDDVQLALDALLDHAGAADREFKVVLQVADGTISAAVGPLASATTAELQHDAGEEGIGLRRLLGTVVDGLSLVERNGESWVELRKSYALTGAGS